MWTVGHSTRSIEEFIGLLKVPGIQMLVDVRRFPASRRYPQFDNTALAQSLDAAGISYQHMVGLGGRRSSRPDSINLGWRNAGFRGYADHMLTQEFQTAIEELMALVRNSTSFLPTHPERIETRYVPISPAHPERRLTRPPQACQDRPLSQRTRSAPISPAHPEHVETRSAPRTVIMCAEAVPWRCHRWLISDTLLVHGWTVVHILSAANTQIHTVTSFAKQTDGHLIYPEETHRPTLF